MFAECASRAGAEKTSAGRIGAHSGEPQGRFQQAASPRKG